MGSLRTLWWVMKQRERVAGCGWSLSHGAVSPAFSSRLPAPFGYALKSASFGSAQFTYAAAPTVYAVSPSTSFDGGQMRRARPPVAATRARRRETAARDRTCVSPHTPVSTTGLQL